MICPKCGVGFKVDLYGEEQYSSSDVSTDEGDGPYSGYGVAHCWCPECDQFIVLFRKGNVKKYSCTGLDDRFYFVEEQKTTDVIIYPSNATRSISYGEVPKHYLSDFNEAAAVLSLSPKASAAISRRSLQNLLQNEFHIKKGSLAEEIEEFIHLKNIPSYISESVDAVRNVGNFASHPLKDSNTGSIVDVEPGEADWLLDVLESLFDFVFIQPKKIEERRQKLNKKLTSLGKPKMKQPNRKN